MSELKIMSHLGPHLNVVNLLGACTKGGTEPMPQRILFPVLLSPPPTGHPLAECPHTCCPVLLFYVLDGFGFRISESQYLHGNRESLGR